MSRVPSSPVALVTDALRTVFDPELGTSVIDLGLVYDIDVAGDRAHITITLTDPACPLREIMCEWVRAAVMRVRGINRVDVTLTFDPPWTPDRARVLG